MTSAAVSKANIAKLLLLIGVVVGMIWGLALCSRTLNDMATKPAPHPTAAEDQFSARVDAEEKVKALLKDPDSAKFGEEFVRDPKLPIVCGEVNARNSFGGYSGASEFVVFGAGALVREPGADNDTEFVRIWNRLCADSSRASVKTGAPASFPAQECGSDACCSILRLFAPKAKAVDLELFDVRSPAQAAAPARAGIGSEGRVALHKDLFDDASPFGFPSAHGARRDRVKQPPPNFANDHVFAQGVAFVRPIDRDIAPDCGNFRQLEMKAEVRFEFPGLVNNYDDFDHFGSVLQVT